MADLERIKSLLTQETLDRLLPGERSDQFFDALLGDPAEGAYDIRLSFKVYRRRQLLLDLELHRRPGKCLACNLTYGLPKVFARHPILNIQGVVDQIGQLLDGQAHCSGWKLGATREVTRALHVVPLTIDLEIQGLSGG